MPSSSTRVLLTLLLATAPAAVDLLASAFSETPALRMHTEVTQKPDALAGVTVTELARREVWQGGRRLTFIRIAEPALPARPARAAAPQPKPTPEQLAADAARAAKSYVNVALMGAVYIGDSTIPSMTEIRWQQRDSKIVREARAFVPFDLRHIQTFTELETADTIYGYTIFLSPCEIFSLSDEQRPPELALFAAPASATKLGDSTPAYVFDGSEADAQALDATLSGLELLLAHALENRAALAAEFTRTEAENAERTRQAALNPPRPKDATIYFWKK